MNKKDYWDLLTDLSRINTAYGLFGPDRDAMAFEAGLDFLEKHNAPETAWTALNCLFGVASMRSFEALAGFCLKKGADIESCAIGEFFSGEASALAGIASSQAPYADPARTIAWLIKSGADVNARAGEALVSACYHSNAVAVEVLLNNNADPLLSGGAAIFAAAWAFSKGRERSAGMLELNKAPGLTHSLEWRAAEMCRGLAQAAARLDAPQARASLKQIDAARASLSDESCHWAARANILPRAMSAALLAAHKHSSPKDESLTVFLRMLFDEDLTFSLAQNWPRNTVLMAGHHLWRDKNPCAAKFLDTMLLADAASALRKLDADPGLLGARSSWAMVAAQQLAAKEQVALSALIEAANPLDRKRTPTARL